MTWEITVSVKTGAAAMPLKRSVMVETGERVNVVTAAAGQRGIPECSAVACSRPERLALLLSSCAGVRRDGRHWPVPVLALDRRGGSLSLRAWGGSVTLEVRHRGVNTPSWHGGGVCCLCADELKDGQVGQCRRCGRRYHAECLRPIRNGCVVCVRWAKTGV